MKGLFNRRDFLRLSSAATWSVFTWVSRPLVAAKNNADAMLAHSPVLQTLGELINSPWTRKHDLPGSPLIPVTEKILYPTSLEHLINICVNRKPDERFKAAGSHWALSEAAISDKTFIETNDPNNTFTAMDRTLYDVVPRCLSHEYLDYLGNIIPEPFDENHSTPEGEYLVHVEAGKRIYQLYSELDLGDDENNDSLAHKISTDYQNDGYFGPWAFETLGGAGGQTVFGAITTGTHGGDWQLPPMADSVMALHLVADGGKHYWIERLSEGPRLTDDDALKELYDIELYGGTNGPGKNFEIIRDNDIFNAVIVSAGRFGIVYSVVLRVVRQYSLHEERRLGTWQAIKSQISNSSSNLYSRRFLQIAISLTPHENSTKNLCGITKRWNVPTKLNQTTLEPHGRLERRGTRLENAGNSHPYRPDPDNPDITLPPSFLERSCSNNDFLIGVIEAVAVEIQELIDKNKVVVGSTIASVTVIGGPGLVIGSLATILLVLLAFLAFLRANTGPRLGNSLDLLRRELLDRPTAAERAAGIFVWQCITYKLFRGQQGDMDYEAISYAVMDGHDYQDKSCRVNVDSIEVFFDATDSKLIAFIDMLIAFEVRQEREGKAFVGYVSLRFTGPTSALIGMQKYPLTCAVEVAGLKDVEGTAELIDYAITLSLDKNFGGILHWGQRNESTVDDIEYRFGQNLTMWRDALYRINEHGLEFSSVFTRRVGLEVPVNPCQDCIDTQSIANES